MLRRALVPTLLLALALPLAAEAGPTAQASKRCKLTTSERQNMGATYIGPYLAVRNTSCGKAKGVVRAYHACRGNKKACKRRVEGYRCSQRILAESPVQYDARVKCRKGGKRVKHTYSQNT